MDTQTRQKVVAEALTWQGTPYAHNQAAKGLAADCAMFPLAVYQTVGVLPEIEVGYYSPQWHLHHSEELYMNRVLSLGACLTDALDEGNFVLWQIGRTYSHGAIIIRWPIIIHALVRQTVQLADATNDATVCRRPFKVFEL